MSKHRDVSWVKALIAGRIVIRKRLSLPLSARDKRLASHLCNDRAVTPRLLGQAVASLAVKKGVYEKIMVERAVESNF
ncbi:MAG: hypothetical protein SGI71_12465 [Verrucomicrobiota bacterium]|nr:hypothetical protein [Verrucomicrobiota bacterium]